MQLFADALIRALPNLGKYGNKTAREDKFCRR